MPILSSLPSYGGLERVTRSLIAAAALLGAPVGSQAADLVALSADRVNATLAQDTILGARYGGPSNGNIGWALALGALGASGIWLGDPKRRKQASERLACLIEGLPSLRKKDPPEEEFLESEMPSNSFSHIEGPIGNPDSDSVSSINSQGETDPVAEYDIHREYGGPIQALRGVEDYMNSGNSLDINMIKKIQERLIRDKKKDESEEVTTLRRALLTRTIELLGAERDSSINTELVTVAELETIANIPVLTGAQDASGVNNPLEATIIPDGTREGAERSGDVIPFDGVAMDDLVRRYRNQDISSREKSLIEECLKHSSKPLEECILLVLLQSFRVRQDALGERFEQILRTIGQELPEDTIDFIIFLIDNKEQLGGIENPAYAICSKIFDLKSFKKWGPNDKILTEEGTGIMQRLGRIFVRNPRKKGESGAPTVLLESEDPPEGITDPERTMEQDSGSRLKGGGASTGEESRQ